ncbi:hypothetical protein [Thiolapillus brandeum]|uniref:Uncharacterized protein n=1 Tax=Thiolapillus brandeum TaxID=1076588 RepID=A0A7U6GKJ1_9GAMM|nr:hypothetical protein [Thiolapillus brandeum]BAO45356.1 conserved hypothetical protein [Thiolapillus brandeum]
MIDEDFYRQTYQEVNPDHCIFEKGMLTNQCLCSRNQKLLIAEREAASCTDKDAQARCREFLNTLQQQARFALKLRDAGQKLGHVKAVKVQIGGLRGLYQALHPDQTIPTPLPEVAGLLEEALRAWKSFDQLPFQDIIPEIGRWEPRRRRPRRKR